MGSNITLSGDSYLQLKAAEQLLHFIDLLTRSGTTVPQAETLGSKSSIATDALNVSDHPLMQDEFPKSHDPLRELGTLARTCIHILRKMRKTFSARAATPAHRAKLPVSNTVDPLLICNLWILGNPIAGEEINLTSAKVLLVAQ